MSAPSPMRPAPYAGQRIALLTQHGKEQVLAPALEPALGCRIELVEGFDTDTLGTFTREVPRAGTQIGAARRKAREGMRLSGLPRGVASEGSFGPDPFTGLFPWNVEIWVWLDDEWGIEVVGMAQGDTSDGHELVSSWQGLQAFAEREGFPGQQLVLRPHGPDDTRLHKDLASWPALKSAYEAAQAAAGAGGKVFAELDLRAFANPRRMSRIGEAALDLRQKLLSSCPACKAPGYWITERTPGLPCAACRLPTREHLATIWSCTRCDHREVEPRSDRLVADPTRCDRCNP